VNLQPRLEVRVSAQERRTSHLEARIEEVSEDMVASFKQISEYLGKIEDGFDRVEKDITGVKGDITRLEGEIADIRATMATKEDIAHLKGEIADIRATMVALNQNTLFMLTQILERLPKSEKER
jgi:chromosome segregation ATPase